MKKINFYKEFNNEKNSISFVSKVRSFYEKHVGVKLSKASSFFKKLGKKFKDKFVEKEDAGIREPIVSPDSIVYTYVNDNEQLFNECVELARNIDKAIKNREDIDFSEEKEILTKLVYELRDSKDNYSKLKELEEKLKKLRSDIFDKMMESNKPKLITSDHNLNNGSFTFNTTEKTNETKTNDSTTKTETKKEDTTVEASEYTDDYSRVSAKVSLIDSKIEALKAKIDSTKFDEVNYHARKIDEIDEIIKNAELFASKLHIPANRRPKKVREMGNEFNLDTKEINDFKIERAYREEKIDLAEDKIEEMEKEIKELEAKKEECNNEYITVKVPNQYAKDGFLTMRMTKAEYERKMEKMRLLDERIALMAEKKAQEERIAKLKAELSELEGSVSETDKKLDSNKENLKINNTINAYEHDTLVSFHKAL